MKSMSTYFPERWVILEVSNPGTSTKIRKVFAGWRGGYLGSDQWKLSSGIVKVVEHEHNYEFFNVSGSVYTCPKTGRGMTPYMAQAHSSWQAKLKELGKDPDSIGVTEDIEPIGFDENLEPIRS
jgi:hypothetical protein